MRRNSKTSHPPRTLSVRLDFSVPQRLSVFGSGVGVGSRRVRGVFVTSEVGGQSLYVGGNWGVKFQPPSR